MAWSHFTTYLDGTRPITKAERDELWDELALKFSAICILRWRLQATHTSTIKASRLLTDRTALEDTALSSTSFGRLEALLGSAASGFSNMSSARASALADESLSEANMTAIIASRLDHFRLWNFYRRWIDALLPITIVQVSLDPGAVTSRTVSATAVKRGFPEFPFSGNDVKRRYRRMTYSGSVDFSYGTNPFVETGTYSGYYQYSTSIGPEEHSSPEPNYYNGTVRIFVTLPGDAFNPGRMVSLSRTLEELLYVINGPDDPDTEERDETVDEYLRETHTLSNEHTTAQVKAQADDEVSGSFAGFYTTPAKSAFRDDPADEQSAIRRKLQYKITMPNLTGYSVYEVQWLERFTPAGGGAPTDTPRTYNWDGAASETAPYVVDAPSANGTTTIIILGGTGTQTCTN